MFIFIRHGEKSKYNNINLSDVGVVRRHHLPKFFIDKKIPDLNIPERIVAMHPYNNDTSDHSYQTVEHLAKTLNVNICSYKKHELNDIVKDLLKYKDMTTLICWEREELSILVEKLIYKLYYQDFKFNWGKNPFNIYNNTDDYTSMWVVDTNTNTLKVYTLFDVKYNKKYDFYDFIYSDVKSEPRFVLTLKDNSYYSYFAECIDFLRNFNKN
jgi:hypothetical protein